MRNAEKKFELQSSEKGNEAARQRGEKGNEGIVEKSKRRRSGTEVAKDGDGGLCGTVVAPLEDNVRSAR